MTSTSIQPLRLTKTSVLLIAALLVVIGLFTPAEQTNCRFVSPSAWQCTTSSASLAHRFVGRINPSPGAIDFGEDALGQPRPANIQVSGIGVLGLGSYAAVSGPPSPSYSLPQHVFERSAQQDAERLVRFIDGDELNGTFTGTHYGIFPFIAAVFWLVIGGIIVSRTGRDD